jgi:para-nitrobenzyl esterase
MNRRNFLERCIVTSPIAGLASFASFGLRSQAAPAVAEAVVETSHGKVRGALVDGVYVFKGLRYAASTAGANRFMPPREPEPWTGIQQAMAFGDSAPQTHPNPPTPGGPPKIILAQLPRSGAPPPRLNESEDCLYLNVWTAGLGESRRRPVMVWLHGGFFAVGSGSSDDSLHLAKRGDVVNVTLNHRLNVLGYSHFGDLGELRAAQSGNVGMLDIIAALKWVQTNIERFGGDPKRVMVFGVSGGGMKTAFLTASPAARGLLHRSGVQSGPGLKMMARADATRVSELLLHELGLQPTQVRQLQQMPLERLMAARFAVEAGIAPGNFTDLTSFAPVLDPQLLPHQPFSPESLRLSKDIPLLIGSNQTDMVFFMGDDDAAFALDETSLDVRLRRFLGDFAAPALAAYRKDYPGYSATDLYLQMWSDFSIGHATTREAERKSAASGAAVYLYRFDWRTPVLGGKLRTPHTLETPFVFDNTDGAQALTGGGADARTLASRMSAAWVAFATTGDPNTNAAGLPHWPAYQTRSRPTMLFDVVSRVAQDPARESRMMMDNALREE